MPYFIYEVGKNQPEPAIQEVPYETSLPYNETTKLSY